MANHFVIFIKTPSHSIRKKEEKKVLFARLTHHRPRAGVTFFLTPRPFHVINCGSHNSQNFFLKTLNARQILPKFTPNYGSHISRISTPIERLTTCHVSSMSNPNRSCQIIYECRGQLRKQLEPSDWRCNSNLRIRSCPQLSWADLNAFKRRPLPPYDSRSD